MLSQPTSAAAGAAYANLAQLALARASAFGHLAFAFFDPTEEFVGQLISGAYLSELNGYYQDLTASRPSALVALHPLKACQADLSACLPAGLLLALKVEFARLFIGPGHMLVPPYEAFYGRKLKESGPLLMVSPAAIAVENAYREAGVTLSTGLHESPDHIATEAEFVYFCCKKESDAWAAGDHNTARLWRLRQLAFLDGHLGKWGCEFFRQVEVESRHPFYQAVAHFGAALIRLEGSDAIPEAGPEAGQDAAAGV